MSNHFRSRFNSHHIVPRSRGGTDENNLVQLPIEFHDLFHRLFQNMTLPEIHIFLDTVMQPGETWDKHEIESLVRRLKNG